MQIVVGDVQPSNVDIRTAILMGLGTYTGPVRYDMQALLEAIGYCIKASKRYRSACQHCVLQAVVF